MRANERRPWTARLEVNPRSVTLVVTEPEGDEVLKAVFTGYPDHPRALVCLLEGVALWSGAALGCVISAEHPVSHSLGLGPFDDLDGHWPQESALVNFQFVDSGRRRRRIRGVGDPRRARRGDDDASPT
jgi:hypothetical protein